MFAPRFDEEIARVTNERSVPWRYETFKCSVSFEGRIS